MIQDVLAFARGQSQVLPRKVWIRDFFNEVEEMLQIELAGSRVQFVVDAQYKGGVRIDDAKMKRVLTNLARNAREAMGGHGGELRITASEEGERVVLRVSDTGPGIPPEMEGRLFQSFSTFGKSHGTGLGLAIVKTIIDQHEGTLEVHSLPRQGTTFVIGLHRA
jgi:signal transduction histidine kinase